MLKCLFNVEEPTKLYHMAYIKTHIKVPYQDTFPGITKVWHCNPTSTGSHFYINGSLVTVPNSIRERRQHLLYVGPFLQHLATVPKSRHEILQRQDRLLRCRGPVQCNIVIAISYLHRSYTTQQAMQPQSH